MVIDADEEFILEKGASYGSVRDFLQRIDKKFPAAALNLKDIQKGAAVLNFSTTRFFRRGMVEYEGIVHNQPILKIDGQAAFCQHAVINHYGYDLTPEQKEKKFIRSSSLLMHQIETGQVVDALPYFYLCQLYADARKHEEAAKWGETYWEHRGEVGEGNFCDSVYFVMTKQYMKIGNVEKANEWLMRGVEALPGDLDMAMAALEYGVWIENNDLKIQATKDFIEIYKSYHKDPTLRGNRFCFGMRKEALAFALFHQCVAELQDGVKAMTNLISLFNELPPAFAKGMMQDLQDEFSKMALPIHLYNKDEEEERPRAKGNNFVMTTIQ